MRNRDQGDLITDVDSGQSQDTQKSIVDGLKAACSVLQAYEASCTVAVNDYSELVFSMVCPPSS